jgi:large subunit ribosomal protein L25
MATQDIAVELEERTVIGKGLQKLRQKGHVPAVIHDHGRPSLHVAGDFIKLTKVYEQAGKHHPVQLHLGKKQQLAMIKDVDFEPTKHRMRHVVFQAIKQDEKVTAEIPLVLTGDEIPAEKMSLLVLTHLDTIEVEALPNKLPDQLEVDATTLAEVGDKLSVADIKVPEGVTILTEPEQTIATVEMPKDQIAEADRAQEELAADKGVAEEAPDWWRHRPA